MGSCEVSSPAIKMVGRGGRSTATKDFETSETHLNDGIYLENSTISSKPTDLDFGLTRKRYPVVLKGYGGEISVEDSVVDGGDLNSGVVLNTRFVGDGSSKIKGFAGKPPKGSKYRCRDSCGFKIDFF